MIEQRGPADDEIERRANREVTLVLVCAVTALLAVFKVLDIIQWMLSHVRIV